MIASRQKEKSMRSITIRDLDDDVVAEIERRAADRGISLEEEARRILSLRTGDTAQADARVWARRQTRQELLGSLRATLNDSIDRGGHVTDSELDVALSAKRAELAKQGF